jgi:hypothetical protein
MMGDTIEVEKEVGPRRTALGTKGRKGSRNDGFSYEVIIDFT